MLAVAADAGLPRRARRRWSPPPTRARSATTTAGRSSGCSSSASRPAASARSTGPAASRPRCASTGRLPRGAEVGASARAVTEALGGAERAAARVDLGRRRRRRARTRSASRSTAPTLSIRLDRQGARVGSLGTMTPPLHGLPRPRRARVPRRRRRHGRHGEGARAARVRRARHRRRARGRPGARSTCRSSGSAAATPPGTSTARWLVVAATPDREVNRAVYEDAERSRIFCNVADDPELCSLILPAVHRVDPIAVAVSTGGASPALAQRLRGRDRRARAPRARRARAASCARCARGRREPRQLRGAARVLRRGSWRRRSSDGLARRRRPGRSRTDHGPRARAHPRLRRPRPRPPGRARARRRGARRRCACPATDARRTRSTGYSCDSAAMAARSSA